MKTLDLVPGQLHQCPGYANRVRLFKSFEDTCEPRRFASQTTLVKGSAPFLVLEPPRKIVSSISTVGCVSVRVLADEREGWFLLTLEDRDIIKLTAAAT